MYRVLCKEKERSQKKNKIKKQERLLFFSLSYCPTKVYVGDYQLNAILSSFYSTVTLLAKFLGLSTSHPNLSAM